MPQSLKSAPSRKDFAFMELKALDDASGLFEGYLSVFGNADSYKDVVDPGSFTKTISEADMGRKKRQTPYMFPLLWQHNPTEPIGGFLDMREDPKGLYVQGQLDLDIEQGRRAYSGLKKGYTDGLSIGYDTIKEQWKDGLRHLKEIRLWEGSIVTFPANSLSLITGVKSESDEDEPASEEPALEPTAHKDFSDHYRQLSVSDWLEDWFDMAYALRQCCMDAFSIGDQPVQDITAALTDPDGFNAAVLKWVQTGIALNVTAYLNPSNDGDQDSPDDAVGVQEMLSASISSHTLKAAVQTAQRRVKEGRVLSDSNRKKILGIVSTMEHALSDLNGLLTTTEPDTSPSPVTTPSGHTHAPDPEVKQDLPLDPEPELPTLEQSSTLPDEEKSLPSTSAPSDDAETLRLTALIKQIRERAMTTLA